MTATITAGLMVAALVIGASLMNEIVGIALAAAVALGWLALFRYRRGA